MNSRNIQNTLFAFYFQPLKEIARNLGYNLFLNTEECPELNLVAVPWLENVNHPEYLIEQMNSAVNGSIVPQSEEQKKLYAARFNGRIDYKILIQQGYKTILYRTLDEKNAVPEKFSYYIKISVTPTVCLAFDI